MRPRAKGLAGGPSSRAHGGSSRPAKLSFARDGSVLTVASHGPWACMTVTRDDGARALDILLSHEDAEELAVWMAEHRNGQASGRRHGDAGSAGA